jgi:single-strand selective monofunctional uracil DNA glycosylase
MLEKITDDLVADLGALKFGPPVTHVYNPLIYARAGWDEYCERFAKRSPEVLMMGMNPGPWGMAQVGVPFGEVNLVHEWMGIRAEILKPADEHPKRPILGYDCPRSEVSGGRLWGWAKQTFETPEAFFARFFVANYCPLMFMEESGRNRVPEKLPKDEREPMFEACDRALRRTIEVLEPKLFCGVGKFAEDRLRKIVGPDSHDRVFRVAHPSPASPIANRGWSPLMDAALQDAGISL